MFLENWISINFMSICHVPKCFFLTMRKVFKLVMSGEFYIFTALQLYFHISYIIGRKTKPNIFAKLLILLENSKCISWFSSSSLFIDCRPSRVKCLIRPASPRFRLQIVLILAHQTSLCLMYSKAYIISQRGSARRNSHHSLLV